MSSQPDTSAPPSPPSPPSSIYSRFFIYTTTVPNSIITPLCGASAGIASGIVTCPLDVIKTRLQAQGSSSATRHKHLHSQRSIFHLPLHLNSDPVQAGKTRYRGMLGTGRTILHEEGIRGFYRGLTPMLFGYLPTWAVYMTVYERMRDFYENSTDNWLLVRIAASVTAGGMSTIVTNPVWVIKTRLMTQSGRTVANSDGRPPSLQYDYQGTLHAARRMYRSEGLRVFYSGLTPALLGLSHVAIQFPLYEFFKMEFTGCGIGETPAPSPSGRTYPLLGNTLGVSLATFLSKICASTATYPHEVLRTRLQTQRAYDRDIVALKAPDTGPTPPPQPRRPWRSGETLTFASSSSDGMPNRPRYRGVVQTCRTILREEGWRAFYAGIGTNLFRAVPSAMTTMLTFEYVKGMVAYLQRRGEAELDKTFMR